MSVLIWLIIFFCIINIFISLSWSRKTFLFVVVSFFLFFVFVSLEMDSCSFATWVAQSCKLCALILIYAFFLWLFCCYSYAVHTNSLFFLQVLSSFFAFFSFAFVINNFKCMQWSNNTTCVSYFVLSIFRAVKVNFPFLWRHWTPFSFKFDCITSNMRWKSFSHFQF